jgi:hypothetical protein
VGNGLTLKFSADEILQEVFCSLRNMKRFSTVLDYMPDIRRQKPVSADVLNVLVQEKEAEVKENIL